MAEQDKPFVCYKAGLSLKITPRNAFGWWSFAAWMALMAVLTALFVWVMVTKPSGARLVMSVVTYVVLTITWAVAMIRWMYLRSEVIDMQELLKLKRELDQKERKRR